MSSSYAINEFLLTDPSLVDKAFDLGLTAEMFPDKISKDVFSLIVFNWYTYYCRPLAKDLLRAGYSGFEDHEPHQTFEEAVKYVIEFYTDRKRLKNG